MVLFHPNNYSHLLSSDICLWLFTTWSKKSWFSLLQKIILLSEILKKIFFSVLYFLDNYQKPDIIRYLNILFQKNMYSENLELTYDLIQSKYNWLNFLYSSVVKESACSAGDLGSIPELGRSPGEGNGNPFQYSCLDHPMDRGAWWATVCAVAKSWTQLSN